MPEAMAQEETEILIMNGAQVGLNEVEL